MLKSNAYSKRRERKAIGLSFLKEKSFQTFNRIKGVFLTVYNYNVWHYKSTAAILLHATVM